MNLTIINDGKGKHKSWEAWFQDCGDGWSVDAHGYGATAQEAREELSNKLAQAAMACKNPVTTP